MAKKTAKKKVSRAKRTDVTKEEQAVADVIDAMTDEEIDEVIDPRAPQTKPVMTKEAGAGEKGEKMVAINIPVNLKIKGKRFAPGVHKVPAHQAATILEMVHRKRKADLSMFTGKNYLLERLLDRTLVIREVDSIDVKQLAR